MKLKNNHAFSLVEILVTAAILTVALGAIYACLTTGNLSWKTHQNSIAAQREVRNILSRMARDIREATAGSVAVGEDNSSITLTRPGIGSISYTLNAAQLTRADPSGSTVIANNVSSLTFTDNTDSVTIEMATTCDNTGGHASTMTLKEKVALRDT